MRCIFCCQDASASVSREHIIPESLGNSSLILPKGVVCDTCNNYFAREVEKPFLQSPAVLHLRFTQELENKKRRVPSMPGIIVPDVPVTVSPIPRKSLTLIDIPPEFCDRVVRMKEGRLIIPFGGSAPSNNVTSRFMAKVALEAMAERVINCDGGQDYICDEVQLDPLRKHARSGKQSAWPVHARTIYDADASTSLTGESPVQVVHECDFLDTSWGEWFFVLAIFGLELTINIGGPDIEGYKRWLRDHNGISPLYRPEKPGLYPMPT